ncbi:hypothetical protein J6590_026905 [Homalodisca vitripennis]|nr:hypothetical protein J6590_026905 [Homalodisca vitripennis]
MDATAIHEAVKATARDNCCCFTKAKQNSCSRGAPLIPLASEQLILLHCPTKLDSQYGFRSFVDCRHRITASTVGYIDRTSRLSWLSVHPSVYNAPPHPPTPPPAALR